MVLRPRLRTRTTAGLAPAPVTFPAPPRSRCRLSSPAPSRALCPLIIFTPDCTQTVPAHRLHQYQVSVDDCIHQRSDLAQIFALVFWFEMMENVLLNGLLLLWLSFSPSELCPLQAGLITPNHPRESAINPVASRELDFSVGLCLCLSVCTSFLLP